MLDLEANPPASLLIGGMAGKLSPTAVFLVLTLSGGEMDQVLEISEDRVEAVETQEVIELSTDFLSQVGGGTIGTIL
jgi:hypothetical protein